MIILAGCGAIGSRIAMEMCNLQLEWLLIDDDTVGQENIGTSAFFSQHLGQPKAVALAELMWRKGRVICKPYPRTLSKPVSSLSTASTVDLVIDAFDNPAARKLTLSDLPTIHLGVDEGEVGSVVWDKHYKSPEIDFERGTNPICTNQLGDLIIRSTVAVGVYCIRQYLSEGIKNSYFLNGCMNIVRINR